MCGGHGNTQQCVGAQAALVLGAIQIDQATVQAGLVGGLEALQCVGDGAVDVVDGLAHALAEVTGLVAVTQLHRLLGAGRCAGGNRGATERTVLQGDFGFQRGVATAVEDFTGMDAADRTHGRAGYLYGEGATKTNAA
ncbi:hypothetical protein D3C81_976200 [compost metagenome]